MKSAYLTKGRDDRAGYPGWHGMKRRIAVCIMGPTAAGKTEAALALAGLTDVDLISVDSAMVYRHMDIGTAKPDPDVLARHPHALIDVREPTEPFSAADFLAGADTAVARALDRGRTPVLVGGSMLYFKAFRDGLSTLPSAHPSTRSAIEERARQTGWKALHAELERLDPAAAARIHPNDPQRIQRALEVFYVSGKPISEWWASSAGLGVGQRLDCSLLEIALSADAHLATRIGRRFDAMLAKGLVDEVARLRNMPNLDLSKPSMRAVGYRQVWRHLDGDLDHDAMRSQAVAATRQLARRQATWLRSWPDLRNVDGTPGEAARQILHALLARPSPLTPITPLTP